MDPFVFGIVLAAAFLHASWNGLVKSGGDPLVRLGLTNAGSGLAAVPLLFFVDPPAAASWPFLFASVVIHQGYYAALVAGYRVGDLSQVYPIARGIAPLLVTIGAFAAADERLTGLGLCGVVIICTAILALAATRDRDRRTVIGTVCALATGVCIAGYTLVDGLGGRLAGDVFGYIAYLFVLDAIPFGLFVVYRRRHRLARDFTDHWRVGAFSGILSLGAYGLVIWAMTKAPMPYVSAVRETSVVMAALIGSLVLKEQLGGRRIAAAALVAAGAALLQISRAV